MASFLDQLQRPVTVGILYLRMFAVIGHSPRSRAVEREIVLGYPDGTFGPDQPVTRGNLSLSGAPGYRRGWSTAAL